MLPNVLVSILNVAVQFTVELRTILNSCMFGLFLRILRRHNFTMFSAQPMICASVRKVEELVAELK